MHIPQRLQQLRVDGMYLLFGAADGVAGAVAQADHAAGALLGDHRVGDQSLAHFRRAAFIKNMRFILIPEIAQGGKHRVGSGLPQAAQRAALDVLSPAPAGIRYRRLAFPGADALQSGQHGFGAEPAGHALAAGFLLGEVHEIAGEIDHAGVFIGNHQCPPSP